ncbi:nose resistant to fluoxetine protein 6 isoform X1 [Dermacentor silvarum]|uniref:nose resistant to fluoxetine protein 6 isoform X1 n=1 Tax=Dermacentor silvarum TaxID=543639 RepID=UPI0021006F4C|nr:nose resistant to fluoxetine protein 6 isoform X1 [Dermacentor silvarum]
MVLEKSAWTGGGKPQVVLWVLVSSCVLLPFLAQTALAQNAAIATGQSASAAVTSRSPDNTASEMEEIDYAQVARDVVAAGLSKVPRSLIRKLLEADVRSECSTALLRTMRAFQNLEPWVLRLFDATGKYPTGLFGASIVDMGAFDECLETVVRDRYGNLLSRGQYCNMLGYIKNATGIEMMMNSISDALHPRLRYFIEQGFTTENSIARLGLCFIEDCNEHDLQVLVNSVKLPLIRFKISNCVTAEPRPWNTTQLGIVIFAAVLLLAIIIGTMVDLFVDQESAFAKKCGLLFQVAMAFSAKSNTRMLLNVASKHQVDQYSLQFLHGVRCLTIMHIVLGHTHMVLSDSFSRLLNLFIATSEWPKVIIPAAFNGVDTFFFISGFLLSHILSKQKGNGPAVFLIAMLRRLIRMCVPLFFVIMWFYLLPRFVTGPDTETFFQKFYVDMEENWWRLLVQIRNFFELTPQDILSHTWYLSTDFQLFVVSLLILLTFRRRKPVALAALAVLSLLGCAIATWTVARYHLLPFIIIPFPDYPRMISTLNEYYTKPFYHAVCYFSGCMTSLIVADFGQRKIPKMFQLAGWVASISCGLFCVFVKFPWYLSQNPTSDDAELVVAFFDRIIWSFCLSWITLACATSRGGALSKFLSWNAFVPLSKLSYGVYLIHWPFLELLMHSSRERVYWSVFNQVTLCFAVLVWCFLLSYLTFIACEAPTGALDKLLFSRLIGNGGARPQEREEKLTGSDAKINISGGEGNEVSLREARSCGRPCNAK